VPDAAVVVTPRIGITRDADRPLRWLVEASAYVSATPRHFDRRRLGA
jgi:3-methyladenine DNA glycosylase Mpg